MRITKVSLGKNIKIGLPNYSNIDVRCDLEAEIGDKEVVDWDSLWDVVNQQLSIQSSGIDPSWITKGETKNFFKTTLKTPKK